MRLQFDREVDYYEVLQVHPKAHPEIIKRAYRTLVTHLQAHPDLGGSHQQMVLINRAYEVLSDADLRAEYDRWRESQTAPPAPRGAAAGAIIAACPACGRRNRVPHRIGLHGARCGACGQRLLPGREGRPDFRDTRRHRDAARRLPPELYRELRRDGQLRVQLSRVARGSRVACRQCAAPWWAPRSGKPPGRCPSCGARDWLTFRLFKCSACGHEFESDNLRAWPYLLFEACPACGARGWNPTAQRSPLRWVMPLVSRLRRG